MCGIQPAQSVLSPQSFSKPAHSAHLKQLLKKYSEVFNQSEICFFKLNEVCGGLPMWETFN